MDTARGVAGTGGFLKSNTTDAAETGYGSEYGPTAYNNNGYTLGSNGSPFNANGVDYVSWTYRKAKNFFDVVTYTGDGVAGHEIPHNLGCVPGFMVVKKLNADSDWTTYHRSMGATQYAPLNDTDPYGVAGGIWNNTEPTETKFTVGDNERMNADGDKYVAYLFAHDDSDESMIKCGSYTGNGNAVGPTIELGFEPQWVMIKSSSNTSNWIMLDNMRGVVADGFDEDLYANLSYASPPSADFLEFTSTGFIPKNNTGDTNSLNQDYIYMAIRKPDTP
jgi:hypothetical protein